MKACQLNMIWVYADQNDGPNGKNIRLAREYFLIGEMEDVSCRDNLEINCSDACIIRLITQLHISRRQLRTPPPSP